jgi:hypothetical protein
MTAIDRALLRDVQAGATRIEPSRVPITEPCSPNWCSRLSALRGNDPDDAGR